MVYVVKSTIDFKNQLTATSDKLVLIDFFASWCGPCKAMESVLTSFEKKYRDRLMIMKVNVDKLDTIADRYKISSLPTFIFYKNGKNVGTVTGADEYKLNNYIKKLI